MAKTTIVYTKEALQACWVSVAFAWVFVIVYAFVGPMILG